MTLNNENQIIVKYWCPEQLETGLRETPGGAIPNHQT